MQKEGKRKRKMTHASYRNEKKRQKEKSKGGKSMKVCNLLANDKRREDHSQYGTTSNMVSYQNRSFKLKFLLGKKGVLSKDTGLRCQLTCVLFIHSHSFSLLNY